MSKYDHLGEYLRKQGRTEVPMSFAEVERVAGVKLPPSAYRHRPWWSNNPSNSVITQIWLDAGYETTQVDMAARKLVFRRTRQSLERNSSGLSEPHRMFKTEKNIEKKPFRSPLWGALKGTFAIEPGWDITKPALDPNELVEMDANLDRTADLIEQGLKDIPK